MKQRISFFPALKVRELCPEFANVAPHPEITKKA
jgi:hypothetical protein